MRKSPRTKLRVLIAEDENLTRRVLKATIERWQYEVVVAANGLEAWEILRQPQAPRMAVLDSTMPGVDGITLCRELRRLAPEPYIYILLLAVQDPEQEMAKALEAGADDYMTKPFYPEELKARLRAGRRILESRDQCLVEAR